MLACLLPALTSAVSVGKRAPGVIGHFFHPVYRGPSVQSPALWVSNERWAIRLAGEISSGCHGSAAGPGAAIP